MIMMMIDMCDHCEECYRYVKVNLSIRGRRTA